MCVISYSARGKYFILLASSFMFPVSVSAQCVATTDCATLGYTETSCPNGKGIKCPFGDKWACPSSKEETCAEYGFKYDCSGTGYQSGSGTPCNNKYASCTCASGYEWKDGTCTKRAGAILGQCTGYAKNCKIGQILNIDGSCSDYRVSGVEPVGIVVYIGEDGCGQAIALKSLGLFVWSREERDTDIPDLPNYGDVSSAEKDFDSCGNTQKIIKQGDASIYPAAWAAANYTPPGIPETNGKWCLPAAGIGSAINNNAENISNINLSLSKVGGESLLSTGGDRFWTSSENTYLAVWTFSDSRRDLQAAYKSYLVNEYDVRPVIEF